MQRQESGATTGSTMRKALAVVLGRSEGKTVIEECRRCGTTLESTVADCPACGCSDVVEYRIQ